MKKDDFEHDSLFGDLNADVPELDPSKQSQGAQAIQEKAADDDAAEAPEEAATEEMAVGAATVGPAEEDGALTLARYASQAYLEYAMSVVKSRALPEVTDGQKPVQRRILIDMYRMGLKFEGRSVKSARIVGDVLGKYHPHGDQSVYDALVRMAQTFSLRYPLLVAESAPESRLNPRRDSPKAARRPQRLRPDCAEGSRSPYQQQCPTNRSAAQTAAWQAAPPVPENCHRNWAENPQTPDPLLRARAAKWA